MYISDIAVSDKIQWKSHSSFVRTDRQRRVYYPMPTNAVDYTCLEMASPMNLGQPPTHALLPEKMMSQHRKQQTPLQPYSTHITAVVLT